MHRRVVAQMAHLSGSTMFAPAGSPRGFIHVWTRRPACLPAFIRRCRTGATIACLAWHVELGSRWPDISAGAIGRCYRQVQS